MWPALFGLTNLIALGGWLALFAGIRSARLQTGVIYAAVGVLCLAYLAIFVALFGDLVDPARVLGTTEPSLSDYSIQGIRALFQSDGGIVLGWTHYLAFDLFTGVWIVRDAAGRWSRLALLPFLLATFLAGPIGLLAWLVTRTLRKA